MIVLIGLSDADSIGITCAAQRVMLLNDELARRAEEAGVQQSAQVAELQYMIDMERETASASAAAAAVDMAEMVACKKEITRLEMEVEQGRMHVKELLFTQKLERNEHAQVLEQKRKVTEERDDAKNVIRQLQSELQVERADVTTLKARIQHADAAISSLHGKGGDKHRKALEDLNGQVCVCASVYLRVCVSVCLSMCQFVSVLVCRRVFVSVSACYCAAC